MTERGSLLVSVVFLTTVAGLSAAALDVSAWYRTNRKLQAGTDGAVLAGAQALPENPRAARTLAGAGKVTFSSSVLPNDTITVRRQAPTARFFGRMFGAATQAEAKAIARAGLPSRARWSAPVAVDAAQRQLAGPNCPCWKQETTIELRLLNLDGSRSDSAGTVASWIRDGFARYMNLGWYSSQTGAHVNSSQVRAALRERLGGEMLLPVYRRTRSRLANLEYHVVGWAGFHLTRVDTSRGKSTLHGWFERVIWEGIQSETGSEDDFGVRTVALIS